MPLTVHGAPSRGMGFDFFNKFLHVHTLEHPCAILIQSPTWSSKAFSNRFPKLRVAFLEAGSGAGFLHDGSHGRRNGKTLSRPSAAIETKTQ